MVRASKVLLTFACLSMSAGAFGQATRTWISGVGDDANPCSRTAPCKTFAGAIIKTAATGEIDALDAVSSGPVTITKAITIDGNGVVAGIIPGGTNGITVNAGNNDVVTIRNITLNGVAGSGQVGINVLNAAAVNLHNVDVSGFTAGVNLATTSSPMSATIDELHSHDNTNYALQVGSSSASNPIKLQINDSHFDRATFGNGVSILDYVNASIRSSTAANNGNFGFYLNGSSGPSSLTIQTSQASGNGGGGYGASSGSSPLSLDVLDCASQGNTGPGYAFYGNSGAVKATIVRSVAGNNGGAGYAVQANSAAVAVDLVDSNALTNTGAGLSVTGGSASAIARLTRTTITNNSVGVALSSGGLAGTFSDNIIAGGVTGGSLVSLGKQ